MSRENIELVRRLFDFWSRGDYAAAEELCDPDAATELEDLTFEGSAGAVFEPPAALISFRSARRQLSPAQARAAAASLAATRRAA